MSQHGYMRHTATPPLVLEIGQKLWQERPILTTGVTAEELRANIGWKSAILLQWGSADPKFHVEGVAPHQPFFFLEI